MRPEKLDVICDGIDAAVFSSDSLFDDEFTKCLEKYCKRWLREIELHKKLSDVEND